VTAIICEAQVENAFLLPSDDCILRIDKTMLKYDTITILIEKNIFVPADIKTVISGM
jgi:hypothetical protein